MPATLSNRRPAWLDLAHRALDRAVLAAYGWPADLGDADLLARLLALNRARAAPHRGAAASRPAHGDQSNVEIARSTLGGTDRLGR